MYIPVGTLITNRSRRLFTGEYPILREYREFLVTPVRPVCIFVFLSKVSTKSTRDLSTVVDQHRRGQTKLAAVRGECGVLGPL